MTNKFKFQAYYGKVMFQSVISEDEGMIFVAVEDLNKKPEDQLWYPANIVFAEKKAIIRQSIGKKDKNGIDIYFGDIIQGELANGNPSGCVSVEYDEERQRVFPLIDETCEVVGTIYNARYLEYLSKEKI